MIKVLFFGPIAAVTGERDVSVAHVPGLTLGRLKEMLAAQYPEAMHLATMMAVNGEHVATLHCSWRITAKWHSCPGFRAAAFLGRCKFIRTHKDLYANKFPPTAKHCFLLEWQ